MLLNRSQQYKDAVNNLKKKTKNKAPKQNKAKEEMSSNTKSSVTYEQKSDDPNLATSTSSTGSKPSDESLQNKEIVSVTQSNSKRPQRPKVQYSSTTMNNYCILLYY